MPLRGLRGATTVEDNTDTDILEATAELLQTMVDKNNIETEDIASIFFSVTPDLDAAFPAVAARNMGYQDTPLMCMREINVANALSRCIRILVHVNTNVSQQSLRPIYLREATSLRPDCSS